MLTITIISQPDIALNSKNKNKIITKTSAHFAEISAIFSAVPQYEMGLLTGCSPFRSLELEMG